MEIAIAPFSSPSPSVTSFDKTIYPKRIKVENISDGKDSLPLLQEQFLKLRVVRGERGELSNTDESLTRTAK